MTKSTSSVRRLLVTFGVLSVCVGLVFLLSPSIEGIVRWPWQDQTVLIAFFTIALVLASLLGPFVLLDEADRSNRAAEIPESVPSTPAPGHDLERILDSRWPVSLPRARRRRIRAEFRRMVIRAIVRTSNRPANTAREALERGAWTDDPVAAAFVRTEPDRESSRLRSLVERVRFPRRTRRTARAIQTLDEGGADDG